VRSDGFVGGGRKQRPQGYRFASEHYPLMQIILVGEGGLHARWPGGRRVLRPGMGVVLPPGAAFTLATPEQGYRGLYVSWDPLRTKLPPELCVLRADRRLRRVVAELEAELGAPSEVDVLPLLLRLLHHRSVALVQEPDRADAAIADRIDALLLASRYSDQRLAELLRPLPLSYRQLGRSYRAVRGCSIKQAQQRMKLAEAARLLEQSTLSITEIAMELGYPSSQHFATCFRHAYAQTPTAYRAAQTVPRVQG